MVQEESAKERRARRKHLAEILKELNISDYSGVRSLNKELLAAFFENALESEMDDHL